MSAAQEDPRKKVAGQGRSLPATDPALDQFIANWERDPPADAAQAWGRWATLNPTLANLRTQTANEEFDESAWLNYEARVVQLVYAASTQPYITILQNALQMRPTLVQHARAEGNFPWARDKVFQQESPVLGSAAADAAVTMDTSTSPSSSKSGVKRNKPTTAEINNGINDDNVFSFSTLQAELGTK